MDALAATDVEALRALGTRRTWRAGAVVFHEGDPTDGVLLLERGTLKLVKVSGRGVERVLGLRTAGDVVGELSAIDGGVRSAMAVAAEPVAATIVPSPAFRRFLAQRPAAALELLMVVASRLRTADRQRAEFGSADATTRVAEALVELATSHGQQLDDGVLVQLLSQDDLAALCGASREAVSRGLRTLRSAGLVRTGRRSVTVVDLAALAAWTA